MLLRPRPGLLSLSACRRGLLRSIQTKAQNPPLAFVFDIDGVLIRGPKVLSQGLKALRILDGENAFGRKIPYVLLTNGGGYSESVRCEKLSKELGMPITPSQYIQSHTVLSKMAHKYADTPVIVMGGELNDVREAAEGYGLRQAYTTFDVLAWNKAVWPFHRLSEAERQAARPVDFSKTRIGAIFVFHDPRNWALDVQVACDLIQTGGLVGGPNVPLDQQENPVELVFCNPDLVWKSDFSRTRLGQGAFKEAFQAVFKALTGVTYPHLQLGKPTTATSSFAEEFLHRRIEEMYGTVAVRPEIYMVGDNPESDIAGANAAKWSSILVKTGVYDPSEGEPAHTPTHIAEDVEQAVQWAIARELERNNEL